MNLIAKLFSKTPSVLDIRVHLKELEREQIKQRRHLDAIAQSKQELVNRAVEYKKAGKQDQVREVFREIRQVEIDISNANGDLRRISLSKTALNSFLRKAQMLEHQKDHKSLQNLMARFQDKAIQHAIDTAEVDDDTFSDMLDGILGETEDSTMQTKKVEDAGFAEFDSAISQMAEAEDSRTDAENRLKQQAEPAPSSKSRDVFSSSAGEKLGAELMRTDPSLAGKIKTLALGDDTGHVFHDLINGIIIWEDPGDDPPSKSVKTPNEAVELPSPKIEPDAPLPGLGVASMLSRRAHQMREQPATLGMKLGSELARSHPPLAAKIKTMGVGERSRHFFQDLIHGMTLQEGHGAPAEQSPKEHFSLVNDAGLNKAGRGRSADRGVGAEEVAGDGKFGNICLCSHQVEECWHNGRASDVQTRDIPEEQADKICLCSHESDECWHNGRAKSIQARDVPEVQDDKICLCSHESDECWHNGRAKSVSTRDIAEDQADKICLCSHESDECWHNGRAKSVQTRDISAEPADKICVCSHGVDECWHKGRGG